MVVSMSNGRISSTVEFYLRPNGRVNLRLNNFTFYKHLKARTNAHRWSCTAYGSKWKCRAHLIITDKLEVLKANTAHSHPPSKIKKPNAKRQDELKKMEFMKQVELKKKVKPKKEKKVKAIPIDSFEPSGEDFGNLGFVVEPPLPSLQDYLVAHSVFANF